MSSDDTSTGIEHIADLDRQIHEPARLMILSVLYVVASADFGFLMSQTGLTYGNLSSHMSKLEEGGYIEVVKRFNGKRPNTMLRLTEAGRAAFQDYRQVLLDLLGDLPD